MKNEKEYKKIIELSYSDYKKVRKTTFPMYLKKVLIIIVVFLLLALLDYIFDEKPSEHSAIITILAGGLVLSYLTYIITLIINKILLKSKYKKLKNLFNISLNDKYLMIDKDIYGYKNVSNYFENDYILYFYVDKRTLVYFDKKKEDEKLVDFIRLKILKEKEYVESKTKYKKHLVILNILFVLSILSLFFVNVIPSVVAKSQLPEALLKVFPETKLEILKIFKENIDSYLIIDYYEYSLVLIIFPTALYILALRLKRIGIKCNWSIACALITSVLIVFISLGYDKYKARSDYKTFFEKKEILNFKIPKNGMYFKVVEDKEMLSAAYFKNGKDADIILEEIKNNNNWGKIYDLDIELHDYLINNNGKIDDCYYSIYDETTNSYDTPIRENGNHIIYSMSYNFKNNILVIIKFEEYV